MKHKHSASLITRLLLVFLAVTMLAACGAQETDTVPPGPVVTPTPVPPTSSFATATPTPTATLTATPTLTPTPPPEPVYGVEAIRWMSQNPPEGITAGKGMTAGLLTLRLPPEAADTQPENIVLVVDGKVYKSQMHDLDPNGSLSLWYAVPDAAKAIDVKLAEDGEVFAALPTPAELATTASYTPLGEIIYTNAVSPLTDLRSSALLDAPAFPNIPLGCRVVAAAEIHHLSRSISRVAIIDMPADIAATADLGGLLSLDKTGADGYGTASAALAEQDEAATLRVDWWQGQAASGLSGLIPAMASQKDRVAVAVYLLAESWNTEVAGDETGAVKGPSGDIRITRVVVAPDADTLPEGVAPGEGEVIVAIDFDGEEAALKAAMAKSDEATMFYQKLSCPSVAAQGNTLYFSVPLLDGPDRLKWFTSQIELPLP